MKYPLRGTGLVERVLFVMLEDDDGRTRCYYRLTEDGAEQARRLFVEVTHAQARLFSGLTARRLGMPEVPR
jgi:DNA-binding PadR family transcriptional regulator